MLGIKKYVRIFLEKENEMKEEIQDASFEDIHKTNSLEDERNTNSDEDVNEGKASSEEEVDISSRYTFTVQEVSLKKIVKILHYLIKIRVKIHLV